MYFKQYLCAAFAAVSYMIGTATAEAGHHHHHQHHHHHPHRMLESAGRAIKAGAKKAAGAKKSTHELNTHMDGVYGLGIPQPLINQAAYAAAYGLDVPSGNALRGKWGVVVDDGHGGAWGKNVDTGSCYAHTTELAIVNTIAPALGRDLYNDNFAVAFTRPPHEFQVSSYFGREMSLRDYLRWRVAFTEKLEKLTGGHFVFASVHVNECKRNSSAQGAIVFSRGAWRGKESVYFNEASRQLGDYVAASYRLPHKQTTRQGAGFCVLGSNTSILVETGFLTNAKDRTYLQSHSADVARGIANGIHQYRAHYHP